MNRKKVYNVFQINIIVTTISAIMIVPIVSLVAYLIDLQSFISITNIIMIGASLALVIFGVSFGYTLLTKERQSRRLKPSYSKEFTFIMTITAMGVLGSGVIYIFIGGQEFYVPHVIIPLGILSYSILYLVGNRFFNIDLLRRQ